jgi:hypothetical protein
MIWIHTHLNPKSASICVPAEGIHALSNRLLGFSVRQPDFWKWGHLVWNGGLVYIIDLNLALGLTQFAIERPWHSSG